MREVELLCSGEMLFVMIVTDQRRYNKVLHNNQTMPVDWQCDERINRWLWENNIGLFKII